MNSVPPKTKQGLIRLTQAFIAVSVALFLMLTTVSVAMAQNEPASNKQPLSFGPDQTIIDLNRLSWEPLDFEGVPPGAEIATLRGNLQNAESLEAVVRFPANYRFPNHSHTSDELYLWIKGDLTYIAEDGTATDLSGQSFISLPGGVPHALVCGDEPCLFYLRYSRPFDLILYPMPELKKY